MRDFAQLVDRDIFAQMLLQIADALVEYRFLAGADMRGSCPLMITFLPQNPQPQHQALQKRDCFQIITRLLLVDLFNRVLQLMHQHFVDRIVQHQNLRQLQRLDKPCDFMHRLNGKMEKEKRFYKFWCWWKPKPFFLEHKKRDIGKNFRYNKITTNYRKEISLCPLLILSYLFSI